MTATISITDKGKTITYHAHHMRDVIEPVKQYGMFGEQLDAKKSSTRSLSTRRTNNASQHRLHANHPSAIRHVGTPEIMGQFPYSWIWVLAPIWIPLLALAGITIILIIAWIIGVIGVLILEKFGD